MPLNSMTLEISITLGLIPPVVYIISHRQVLGKNGTARTLRHDQTFRRSHARREKELAAVGNVVVVAVAGDIAGASANTSTTITTAKKIKTRTSLNRSLLCFAC